MALPTTLDWQKHPVLTGGSAGVLLSVLIAVLCPEAELQPGDSRVAAGVVGMVFLVPACVGTLYALRSVLCGLRQIFWMRYFWMAAVLITTVILAADARSKWAEARRFQADGIEVRGTILETHPEDHDTLLVAYDIEGREFRAKTKNPHLSRVSQPGQMIPVYYYPVAPSEGFCVEPRWRPAQILLMWVLVSGIVPLWPLGLMSTIERRMSWHRAAAAPLAE